MSACLSVRVSVCLSVCLSVCAFVRLSVCQYVCLSVRLFICMTFCLSICFSVRLCISQSVCPSVCLSVCPPVPLSFCLSVRLTSCPPICLSVRPEMSCLSLLDVYFAMNSCSMLFTFLLFHLKKKNADFALKIHALCDSIINLVTEDDIPHFSSGRVDGCWLLAYLTCDRQPHNWIYKNAATLIGAYNFLIAKKIKYITCF